MTDTDPEIEFLRAVEDLFATLRGVPHLLSPKDVQLARTWWKDEVPLAAVTAGVTEVIEKRRETGDGDQVVSLSYCRHAVRRQAKRLKEQHVGAHSGGDERSDTDTSISSLAGELRQIAEATTFAETGEALEHFATQVDALRGNSPALVDEQLFALETALLEACRRTLPQQTLADLEDEAVKKTAASGATGTALKRSQQAILDREIRQLLNLPRLEIQ